MSAMSNKCKWHIFLIVIVLCSLYKSYAQDRYNDSLALVALYDSCGGADWTNSVNWKSEFPLEQWGGVKIKDNRVEYLSLYNNNLSGQIPAAIGKLDYVWQLILSKNNLSGPIPTEIGSMSRLQYLKLYKNDLSGPLPSQIGNLTNLVYLNACYNSLSGTIPPEIGQLVNLNTIKLNNNLFSGALPSEFGNCISLVYISLSENLFSGTIPSTIGNLLNVEMFEMGYCQLDGPLPSEMGNLVNLRYLSMDGNAISGSIPASFSNLSNLTGLFLLNNNLSGTIPVGLSNCTKLEKLYLSSNQLSGGIPSDLYTLSGLKELRLGYNQLSGHIDASVGQMDSLEVLHLNKNNFTGVIPGELGNCSALLSVYLYTNELSGIIPDEIGRLDNCFVFKVDENQLTGVGDSVANMSSMSNFNVAHNHICEVSPAVDTWLQISNSSWRGTQTCGAPNVTISATPQSGHASLLISFTATNSGGPVTSWSWNFGDSQTSTEQNPVHQYSAEGTYTATLIASSIYGTDVENITITVDQQSDTTPPVVIITSPADGFLTNQNTVNITWTIDGVEQTTELTASLIEGSNAITRSATDAAGNVGTATITVDADFTAPLVAITSPADGFLTNQPTANIVWTIDDVEQTTELTASLIEGSNTITRSATDAAGNVGTATITVDADFTAPVVAITSPADGFLTNQSTADITWTIDGVEQTTELSESLVEGSNTITRSSTDAAGNVGTATITVDADFTAPVVAITSPEDGFLTNQSTANITWTIDGVEQTSELTASLIEGSNTITRSSTDAAGNVGTATIIVDADFTAPVVAITSPADGFMTNQPTAEITWTIDGLEQTTELTASLAEGPNTITRSSTDAAGNIGTATITVDADFTAPVVAITSPADGFLTNHNVVDIAWTVDGVEQAEQLTEALVEGDNMIIRIVTDEAGNIGADTIAVTYTISTDLIEIISPVDGFISDASDVVLTVQQLPAELTDIAFLVDGSDESAAFQYATGQYTATLPLNDGHYTFTVCANYGSVTDTVRNSFKVITAAPNTTITMEGLVVDGKTLEPIPSATVTIEETGVSTVTNGEGLYLISTSTMGLLRLKVTHPEYTNAMKLVSADLGIDVQVPTTLIMPRNVESVTVPANQDTIIALSDSLVEIEFDNTDNSQLIDISATVYNHIAQLPNVQPAYDVFLFGVDLQPEGTVFEDSVVVRVKNQKELTAGAEVPITYFNENTAKWDDVGTGYVTADGEFIEFKVMHFSAYHGNVRPCKSCIEKTSEQLDNNDDEENECKAHFASSVSIKKGDLTLDYLVSGGNANTGLDVELYYYSKYANPRIVFESTIDKIFFSPTYQTWSLYLPGQRKQWMFNGATSTTAMKYIWNCTNKNGEQLPSGLYLYGIRMQDIFMPGRYQYDLSIDHNAYVNYDNETTLNSYYYGFTFVNNDSNNPYGYGWNINIPRIFERKRNELSEFPDDEAFRRLDSDIRMTSPDESGVEIDNGAYSTALGKTRGTIDGEHVFIMSKSGGQTYWDKDEFDRYTSSQGVNDTLYATPTGWIRKYSDGSFEEYNAAGLLVSAYNQYGNEIRYTYDRFGERLLRITDVETGKFTELVYDNYDRLQGIVDPYGRRTEITIDNSGNLTQITGIDGIVKRTYSYDEKHLATRKTLADSTYSEYEYDDLNNINVTRSQSGRKIYYNRSTDIAILNDKEMVPETIVDGFLNTQNGVDLESCVKHELPEIMDFTYSYGDTSGLMQSYKFNSFGYVIEKANALGEKTRFKYDEDNCGCGKVTITIYPNGLEVSKLLDENGNVVSVYNSVDDTVAQYTYIFMNGRYLVESSINAIGQITNYHYDSSGKIIRIIANNTDTTTITYTENNQPETITNSIGQTTQTVYDALGKVSASINPTGDTTYYFYDAYDNIQTIIDPEKREINYEYNTNGQLVSETDGAGNKTTYHYNTMGHLDSLVDPKGQITTFEFDDGGNIKSTTNHLGISRNYLYNDQGQLLHYTNARGQTINYIYDALGRLISKTGIDSALIAQFGYDNMGNLVYARTPEHSVNRQFDLAGRMLKEDVRVFEENSTSNAFDTLSANDFSLDYTHVVIDGDTVIIDGEHHFLSLTLRNNAVVKHLSTDCNTTHRLIINARDSICIDSTSKIDVTGLGYLGGFSGDNQTTLGRTVGNTTNGGSTPRCGGSHGGRGGIFESAYGGYIGFSSVTFDDRLNPWFPGGGGGSDSGAVGSNGGGVIHLNAALIRIDGQVLANGENGIRPVSGAFGSAGGAGAGGSIKIEAESLLGFGFVEANGGDGIPANPGGYDHVIGGGGGRLSISADTLALNALRPTGGYNGGKGGSRVISTPDGRIIEDIIVESGDTLIIDQFDDRYEGDNLIINNTVCIFDGTHNFGSIELRNAAVLMQMGATDSLSQPLVLNASYVYIDSTSKIDVSEKGYSGETSDNCAYTQDFTCAATGMSGGSYGGLGACDNGYSGFIYGSKTKPTSFGSGGGRDISNEYSVGGNGGGAVIINSKIIENNGAIQANGGLSYNGGGGSGGSIFLSVDTLYGKGGISANGGFGFYGGGGGGRIAIHGGLSPEFFLGQIYNSGGVGRRYGQSGTIYSSFFDSIRIEPTDTSILDFIITQDTVIDEFDYSFDNSNIGLVNATVEIRGEHAFYNLSLWDSSIITNSAYEEGQGNLNITVIKTLHIDSTSCIDMTGKGYPGGITVGGESHSIGNATGSHGGVGEFGNCSTYGSYFNPDLPGAGGSQFNPGGGVIKLQSDILLLDGAISANGYTPQGGWFHMGGAGGSIVIDCDSIRGTGSISANGALIGQRGGGGRVAIYCPEIDNIVLNNISVNGYGLGTIYIHDYTSEDTTVVFNGPGINYGHGPTIISADEAQIDNKPLIFKNFAQVRFEGPIHAQNVIVSENSHVTFIDDLICDNIIVRNGGSVIAEKNTNCRRVSVDSGGSYVSGGILQSDTMLIDSSGVLSSLASTEYNVERLHVEANIISIDRFGVIDVTGRGYPAGITVGGERISFDYCGGSHGGTDYHSSCPTYGNYFNPDLPGSGGSHNSGGGVIFLQSDKLLLDGLISANGNRLGYYGPGAGGSIVIACDSLVGSGSISASGGLLRQSGGGGRIAIYCPEINETISNNIFVDGYGVGTIYIHDYLSQDTVVVFSAPGVTAAPWKSHGATVISAHDTQINNKHLILRNDAQVTFEGTINPQSVLVTGNSELTCMNDLICENIIVSHGATVVAEGRTSSDKVVLNSGGSFVSGSLLQSDTIEIASSGVLTSFPSSDSQVERLTIEATLITIDSSAAINVNGKGYPGGITVNGELYSTNASHGGSHGGTGYGNSCSTYGNYLNPDLPGAGGGSGNSGGGVISLQSHKIILGGSISANSARQSGAYGGGAGGSILIACDSILGAGSISANSTETSNPGGGGRIAIYCSELSDSVKNNLNTSGYGAGTIYLKDGYSVNGTLILNNNGSNAPVNSTNITSVGTGTINAISQDSLACDTCDFPTLIVNVTEQDSIFKPGLRGLCLTVNPLDYNDTSSQYKILWNDSTKIVIDTTGGKSLLGKAVVGDEFQGIIHIDTIIIRGGAKGQSDDPVIYDYLEIDNGEFSDPLNGDQIGGHFESGEENTMRLVMNTTGRISTQKTEKIKRNSESTIGSFTDEESNSFELKACDNISIFRKIFTRIFKRKELAETIDSTGIKVKQKHSVLVNPKQDMTSLNSKRQNEGCLQSIEDHNSLNKKYTEKKSAFVSRFKLPGERNIKNTKVNIEQLACTNGDPIYTYDRGGRVTSMTSPVGTTRYMYDSITGHLDTIVSPQGKVFDYQYEKGRINTISRPNGITTHFTFNDGGTIGKIDHQIDGMSLRSYEYEYDKNGMRNSLTEFDGATYYEHTYEYDALYQINEAIHPNYPTRPTELFEYDEVGNWLGDGRIHNELNQLVEDDSCFYDYDADGNMTRKIQKSTQDTTTYEWNIENRLVKVNLSNNDMIEYAYGPLGRRLMKSVNGTRTEFRYDGQDLIFEMDDQDSITVSYTYGPGIDQPLMMHRNDKNYYYLTDGLGSVTAITDSVGDVLQEYSYSVFGEILEQTADSIENRFTYTAREWDQEIGLYYYRNRFYNPQIGRFISEDPIGFGGGSYNLYRYVDNNPLNWIDPLGLKKVKGIVVCQNTSTVQVTYQDGSTVNLPAATGDGRTFPGANAVGEGVVTGTAWGPVGPWENSKQSWQINSDNPFGPAIIQVDGTDSRHIHGTSGPIDGGIDYIGGTNPADRQFTHGCARLTNDNIIDLKRDIDETLNDSKTTVKVKFSNSCK